MSHTKHNWWCWNKRKS